MRADNTTKHSKTTQMLAYIFHALFVAVIYGLFSFFVIYRLMAGQDVLYAYLWNIGFIIVFLVFDKVVHDVLLSKELIITKKNYFIATMVHTASFISFKTVLYLFYTFILIISRVSMLQPEILNDMYRNFVLSIEYCLILLVAFDKFLEHLLKDERRIRRITAKFERFTKYVTERRGRS